VRSTCWYCLFLRICGLPLEYSAVVLLNHQRLLFWRSTTSRVAISAPGGGRGAA
jgi:hypothetical protein